MKKFFYLSLLSAFILTLFLSGCGNNTTKKSKSTKITKINSTTNRVFTLSQLKKYNGKNGNPAYVAVSGIVYNVTHANGWKNGEHQGYSAGKDLTKQIKSSPHGKDVLNNLQIVGKMK